MKNKILFMGSLCLILAFSLAFTGCKNETQVIDFGTIASPKNVTAEITNTGLLVKWDAVKDAARYQIVATRDNAKTILEVTATTSSVGSPIYADDNTIPDIDKWSHTVTLQNIGTSLPLSGSVKIGVVAHSRKGATNRSSPGWAPAITIPSY